MTNTQHDPVKAIVDMIHGAAQSFGPGVDIYRRAIEDRIEEMYGIRPPRQTVADTISRLIGHRPHHMVKQVDWLVHSQRNYVRYVLPHNPLLAFSNWAERPYRAVKRTRGARSFYRHTDDIPLETRVLIYNHQQYCCAGCGGWWHDARGFHVDHVMAVGAGGEDTPGNWQLLCSRCNEVKGKRLTTKELWEANIQSGYMRDRAAARIAHEAARGLGNLWSASV